MRAWDSPHKGDFRVSCAFSKNSSRDVTGDPCVLKNQITTDLKICPDAHLSCLRYGITTSEITGKLRAWDSPHKSDFRVICAFSKYSSRDVTGSPCVCKNPITTDMKTSLNWKLKCRSNAITTYEIGWKIKAWVTPHKSYFRVSCAFSKCASLKKRPQLWTLTVQKVLGVCL